MHLLMRRLSIRQLVRIRNMHVRLSTHVSSLNEAYQWCSTHASNANRAMNTDCGDNIAIYVATHVDVNNTTSHDKQNTTTSIGTNSKIVTNNDRYISLSDSLLYGRNRTCHRRQMSPPPPLPQRPQQLHHWPMPWSRPLRIRTHGPAHTPTIEHTCVHTRAHACTQDLMLA